MKEIWKRIEQSPRYEISNLGNFRRVGTVKNLKPIIRNGYPSYQYLRPDGKLGRSRVSKLVATAFVPNPENRKWVGYIDGDTMNNQADNLEWLDKFPYQGLGVSTNIKCGYIITDNEGNKQGFYTLDEVKRNYFPEVAESTRLTRVQLKAMLAPQGATIKRVGSDEVSMYYERDPELRKEIRNEIDKFVDYVTEKYGKFWFQLSYKKLKADPVVAKHYSYISNVR